MIGCLVAARIVARKSQYRLAVKRSVLPWKNKRPVK